MTDNVTPIRDTVSPGIDAAQKMRDAFNSMITDYVERNGRAPHTVCVALLGSPIDATQESDIMAYCPTDTNTARLQACGAAALLFTRHAIGG